MIEREYYTLADAAARNGCTEADLLHLAAMGELLLCFLLPPGILADRYDHVGKDRPLRTETAIDPHDFVGIPREHARHLELRGYSKVPYFIDLTEPGHTWWPNQTKGSTDRHELTIRPSQVVVRASDLLALANSSTPTPHDLDRSNEAESANSAGEREDTDDEPASSKNPADWFDLVPISVLEKMFPTETGKWRAWGERAKNNGLHKARLKRGLFNPFIAGEWFLTRGVPGWDTASIYRTLAKNLPERSKDRKDDLVIGLG